MEFQSIFGLSVGVGFYNDMNDGPHGNAGALQSWPFVPQVGIPHPEGLLALGDKCLSIINDGVLSKFSSAARAAICAHELGHILQVKYVGPELNQLRIADHSVVRTELHADFVCGYYASVRQRVQSDYPAVISADTQFKFGDEDIADPLHHGTPHERGAAVEAGYEFGLGARRNPAEVARAGLNYVKNAKLTTVQQ
jgi:hypothetical protein